MAKGLEATKNRSVFGGGDGVSGCGGYEVGLADDEDFSTACSSDLDWFFFDHAI